MVLNHTSALPDPSSNICVSAANCLFSCSVEASNLVWIVFAEINNIL